MPVSDQRLGIILGLIASGVWGGAALYWIETRPASPVDVLAHRAVWTLPAVALVLLFLGRLRTTLAFFRQPKILLVTALAALVISINWITFLYAVTHEQATDASLGYFLIPIFSVVLGMWVFDERPTGPQKVAIGFACLSVLLQVLDRGGLPLISLTLSMSFACYGVIRKKIPVDSIEGLFLESAFLVPFGLGWFLFTGGAGLGAYGLRVDVFLVCAGAFTALPLLTHVAAARLLPLSTLGLLSYVGPTLQLLVAQLLLKEPLGNVTLVSFLVLWTGLAFILIDTLRSARRLRKVAPGKV